MKIIEGQRAKYDGIHRNPYNEIECGSNYARAMATYSLLTAFSGFSFDLAEQNIGFNPIDKQNLKCLWALGDKWGNVLYTETKLR